MNTMICEKETMTKPVYIHYGSPELEKVDPIRNSSYLPKPVGGLWASRKDDLRGWKRWCICEEFHLDKLNISFEFVLKDNARVLELSDADQLDDLPKINRSDRPYDKNDQWSICYLDFEKLSKEYDAVEVVDIGHFYWPLYGWDCNSIVIMNPDIVEIKNAMA